MRFSKFLVVASVVAFAACGGGDAPADVPADTPAPVVDAPATTTPVTGTTHVVQMTGDMTVYKFEPNAITIKQGDAIKFEFVAAGPHNVAFDEATLSADAIAALTAGMEKHELNMGPLASRMLLNVGESVTVNFANVPPGTYTGICTPHIAMGMTIAITVE